MKTELELTITKSQVEVYKIRSNEFAWADITIDASGNKGRISIASDYGSWQNYWGACGESFKQFLQGLNIDYAANKFGADRWFDLDGTIKYLEERIQDYSTGDDKEGLLNELNDLKDTSGKEEFIHVIQNCDSIMEMEDHMPDLNYSIEPSFKSFWNELWPELLREFKKESNH